MIEHTSPISCVAAYEEKYIATAGYDNRIILWTTHNKTAIARGMHDHLANQCVFSPCGQYLLSSSSDYTARLWSVPDMKLLTVFSNHTDDVEGLAFHPSQNRIATTSRDRCLRVFDFNSEQLHLFSGHTRDVLSVVWLNENTLVSSSDDGTIKYWCVNEKRCIKTLDMKGVETDTVALTTDGVVFAGDDQGCISILYNHHRSTIQAHTVGIKKLCYSAILKKLVSLSYDGSFAIWDFQNSTDLVLVKRTHYPHIVWARSCDFLGQKQLVFGTFGSSYIIYDYEKNIWYDTGINDTHGINAVGVYQKKIATVGDAGIVRLNGREIQKLPSLCNFIFTLNGQLVAGGQTGALFDVSSGTILYQHGAPLNCAVAYQYKNTHYCALGSYLGEIIILKKDVETSLFVVEKIFIAHDNAVKGLAVSKRILFSVCAAGTTALHHIQHHECIKYFPYAHKKIANDCVYLGENSFASVSRDLKLRLFNANTVTVINTPHKHSIKCLAVSADGQQIATGCYRGYVGLYHLGHQIWQYRKITTAGISSIYFDPMRQCFIAGSYDGQIYYISTYCWTNNLKQQDGFLEMVV